MVNTIYIACAQSQGGNPRRQRFGDYNHDMGQVPSSLANEVEGF